MTRDPSQRERRVLLTGGSGQVGLELLARAPADWRVTAPDRTQLDLGDPAAIEAFVAAGAWDVVVNCAAYTAVDRAQSDPVTAWRVNALAPAALARATAETGTPLLQVSTDYVFDGAKAEPYLPGDRINPLSVYGASKAGGELAIRTLNPRHVVVRTAWVVSPHGANFVKTMLRLGAERDQLRVVADQRGCPTAAGDLAAALTRIATGLIEDPEAPTGTYHFVNDGEATWWDLANAVFETASAHGRRAPQVAAITTADYPTPAPRPANSRLDTEALRRAFGIAPRPWRIAVDEIVATLLSPHVEGPQ